MENKKKYCNPLPFSDGKRCTNPDPFVTRWCGKYYCYATDENGVKVSVSEDLVHWSYKGICLQEEGCKDYWAPSVFYSNGKFYMYYSNITLDAAHDHDIWLKLAVSDSPEGPFEWKKTFFDKFSIDSHPFVWNEKLYMFYSVNDWIGTDEKVAGTIILVDEMLSPEEFAGNPKPVVLPTLEQEIFEKNRFKDGRDWYTLEGAATVIHGNKCYVTYSANAYLNVDYFVGTVIAEKKDNLMDMEWKKYPSDYEWCPLLVKNDKVEGTGHNTITKAPNMVDDWIVYHGRMAEEELVQGLEQREMRIDPLYFNGDRMICDGPTQEEKDAPKLPLISGTDMKITEKTMLAKAGKFYLAEYWISVPKHHIGCRYDIYLAYQDEKNYLKLQMHSGRRCMEAIECSNGVQMKIGGRELAADYDYSVPHLITAVRRRNHYEIKLDDTYRFEFAADNLFVCEESQVGIITYFNPLMLHSFAMTETMELLQKDLIHMTENYDISDACADENGLQGMLGELSLKSHITEQSYTEEIQMEAVSNHCQVLLESGDDRKVLWENKTGRFSIYRMADGKEIKLLVNGQCLSEKAGSYVPGDRLVLKNVHINSYRYTKN